MDMTLQRQPSFFCMSWVWIGVLMFWLGTSLAGDLVDLNSATPDQLKALPGMNEGYVMMIVGARPFQAKEDLLEQKILPQETYEQLKDRIFVKGGSGRPPLPSAVPSSPPKAASGDSRAPSETAGPSESEPGRVCIKEERTRQLMCGKPVR